MIQVPVSVATIGVLCSILGTAGGAHQGRGVAARAAARPAQRTLLSTGLIAVLSLVLVLLTAGPSFVGLWGAMIVGLVAGNVIGYFTSTTPPTTTDRPRRWRPRRKPGLPP